MGPPNLQLKKVVDRLSAAMVSATTALVRAPLIEQSLDFTHDYQHANSSFRDQNFIVVAFSGIPVVRGDGVRGAGCRRRECKGEQAEAAVQRAADDVRARVGGHFGGNKR